MIPNSLKTDGKFNPYLVILPAFGVLALWQGTLTAGGAIKIVYDKTKSLRTSQ